MSVWSIALRLLLSLCLVLNGVTAAMASVTPMGEDRVDHFDHLDRVDRVELPMAPDTSGVVMHSPDVGTGVPPCHQHGASDEPSAKVVELASLPDPDDAAKPQQHGKDCCKSGSCQCACVHIAQAEPPACEIDPARLANMRSLRALPMAHAAPALPHLIRPPIG